MNTEICRKIKKKRKEKGKTSNNLWATETEVVGNVKVRKHASIYFWASGKLRPPPTSRQETAAEKRSPVSDSRPLNEFYVLS